MCRQIKGSAVCRSDFENRIHICLSCFDVSVAHAAPKLNCRVTTITRLCTPYAGVNVYGAWLVLATTV
jgi:hypothetical protein